MAIKRILINKDATICNYWMGDFRSTGSNLGADEVLETYKENVNTSGSLPSWGRILLQASSSVYSASAYTSGTYHLIMRHAQSVDPVPSSFELFVYPVTGSWTEGTGLDHDTYRDKGAVNWEYRTSTQAWATTGSDFETGASGSMLFDTGLEDLECDITTICSGFKSGTYDNFGLLVKLGAAEENGSDEYYIKKFFGRNSHFKSERPYIELRYLDDYKDNRGNFKYDQTSSLMLYNENNGIPGEISDLGRFTVTIAETASAYSLVLGDATYIGNGMYQITGAVPYSALRSGSGFFDYWWTGSGANLTTYMTGAVSITQKIYGSAPSDNQLMVKSFHKQIYKQTDEAKIRVKFYKPETYVTSVMSASNFDSNWLTYPENSYYEVYDYHTGEEVIGYGDYTKLSYDISGSYFFFDFSSLVTGSIYSFNYYVDEGAGTNRVGSSNRFKVE